MLAHGMQRVELAIDPGAALGSGPTSDGYLGHRAEGPAGWAPRTGEEAEAVKPCRKRKRPTDAVKKLTQGAVEQQPGLHTRHAPQEPRRAPRAWPDRGI